MTQGNGKQLTLIETHDEGAALIDALRENHRLLSELSVRYEIDSKPKNRSRVSTAADIASLLSPEMEDLPQEQLRVVLLDVKNGVIGQRVIYQGNVSQALVRVAEVLRPAIAENAPCIIIAHNHPSGDPTPSPDDMMVTRKIGHAARLMDIELLDHIIIGRDGHQSLKLYGGINWDFSGPYMGPV